MNVKKFTRGDKAIDFKYLLNPSEGNENPAEETHSQSVKVAPLPSLDEALQELSTIVIESMEFPKTYSKGIAIVGFTCSYTKRGTCSVSIIFTKALDKIGVAHRLKTPLIRLENGAEGEEGKVETKLAHLAFAAIKEVELFISDPVTGRSQQLLDLKETGEKDETGNLKIV